MSPSPTAATPDSNCGEKIQRVVKKKTLNKVWHSLKLLLGTSKQFRGFGCVIFILSSSVQLLLYRLYLNVSDGISHCYYWMWSCTGLLFVKCTADWCLFLKSNIFFVTFFWHYKFSQSKLHVTLALSCIFNPSQFCLCSTCPSFRQNIQKTQEA